MTEQELAALAKVDEAVQAIFELPAIRPDDFWDVVIPACTAIQNIVMTAAQRPGAQ